MRSDRQLPRLSGALALGLLLVTLQTPGTSAARLQTEASAAVDPHQATNANGHVIAAAFNQNEVNFLKNSLSAYLDPGDGIALVTHSQSSASTVDGYAANLTSTFPTGSYAYRAYWGLTGVNASPGISSLSSTFTQVSADWEVNGPSQFKANPFCTPWFNPPTTMTTCQFFRSFAETVNATGRTSVAYVTGQGIFGDYVKYGWDYGTIASEVGGLTVETQGYAHDLSQWESALNRLSDQFSNHSQPLSKLSVQVSLGVGGNGVNVSDAVAAIDYAYSAGIPTVFLWYTQAQEAWATTTLSEINRTLVESSIPTMKAPPPPTAFDVSGVGVTSATFNWTDPVAASLHESTLYIDGNGDDECDNWTIIQYVAQPVESITLYNLTGGVSYCAFATVTNVSGESPFSAELDFYTGTGGGGGGGGGGVIDPPGATVGGTGTNNSTGTTLTIPTPVFLVGLGSGMVVVAVLIRRGYLSLLLLVLGGVAIVAGVVTWT